MGPGSEICPLRNGHSPLWGPNGEKVPLMKRPVLERLSIAFFLVLCIESMTWSVVKSQPVPDEIGFAMLWLYPTAVSDFGYSYSIDRGRQVVEQTLMNDGTLLNILSPIHQCYDPLGAGMVVFRFLTPFEISFSM